MARVDYYSPENDGPGRDEEGPFERIEKHATPLRRLGQDVTLTSITASIRQAILYLQAQYANIKEVTGITEKERMALIEEHTRLYRRFLQNIGYRLSDDDELPFLSALDPLIAVIEKYQEKPMTLRDAIALTMAGSW